MPKIHVSFIFFLVTSISWAQEISLPADFRQHNLTQFNANLVNASYSLNWNHPSSLAVWSRWQWQTIDGDPTSLFVNYTHSISANSSFGIGFLQHNTGVYLNTGANLNYAHAIALEDVKLVFGMNVFGFQQEVADESLIPNPNPTPENPNDFIIAISPSARLQINGFGLGFALENAIDINLSNGDNEEDAMAYIGTVSYDFPVTILPALGQSFVRPIIYVKSVSNVDTQVGINALLSTSKFWVQGGYNNFYGLSGGAGVTLAKQFSIGGLMEFATDDILSDQEPTLELIAAYHFGKSDSRKKVVGFDVEKDDELALARMKAEEERKEQETLEAQKVLDAENAKKKEQETEQKLAEEKRKEIEKEQQLIEQQQRERDSVAEVRVQEQRKLAEQRKRDSIAALQNEKVEVKPNEKYEEVTDADGLKTGFYLIANVFGTKRYFESFLLTLKKSGLEPKSFYRSQNKFNYVYLERYNTMQEARKARDSKFFGKYADKTWIFRVRNE